MQSVFCTDNARSLLRNHFHAPSDQLTLRFNILRDRLWAKEIDGRFFLVPSVLYPFILLLETFCWIVTAGIVVKNNFILVRVNVIVLIIKGQRSSDNIIIILAFPSLIFVFWRWRWLFAWAAADALFGKDASEGLRPKDVHDGVDPDEVLDWPSQRPDEYAEGHAVWRVLAISLRQEHCNRVD